MTKRMIVDTANLLFRVAAAHGKYNSGTAEEQAGLAMHMALNSLNKYYKKFYPDQLAMTFEGGNNWRKTYTKSPACKSKKIYKANRVSNPALIPFFELINSFEQLARQHTSLVCLSNPKLEGDDLIAGYVQKFSSIGDEIIIISGDKDFVQLLKYPNVTLLDPDKGIPRSVEDICGINDAQFFMFEKCFRGDKSDNVWPAYPRILKKRLLKAYNDEYELLQLMNERCKIIDENNNEIIYTVQELFEENNLLMNLECQPDDIRKTIDETINYELENHGKFSYFHFMKFCGRYGLKQIGDNAQQYINLFSVTGKNNQKKLENKKVLIEF